MHKIFFHILFPVITTKISLYSGMLTQVCSESSPDVCNSELRRLDFFSCRGTSALFPISQFCFISLSHLITFSETKSSSAVHSSESHLTWLSTGDPSVYLFFKWPHETIFLHIGKVLYRYSS